VPSLPENVAHEMTEGGGAETVGRMATLWTNAGRKEEGKKDRCQNG